MVLPEEGSKMVTPDVVAAARMLDGDDGVGGGADELPFATLGGGKLRKNDPHRNPACGAIRRRLVDGLRRIRFVFQRRWSHRVG